jgi:hypothetical protein
MEDEESEALKQWSAAFSRMRSRLSLRSELFVVFGGHRAGKSITVDLLVGKQLILYHDI